MRTASITVYGRLYVPEPRSPTCTFFRYLVELADDEVRRCQFHDAILFYEQAVMRVPAGFSTAALDAFHQMLEAARATAADPTQPKDVVAAQYHASCSWLVQHLSTP